MKVKELKAFLADKPDEMPVILVDLSTDEAEDSCYPAKCEVIPMHDVDDNEIEGGGIAFTFKNRIREEHEDNRTELAERLSASPLEPLHETTDVEIHKQASRVTPAKKGEMFNSEYHNGYVAGAKWMRSRLLPSNPESPSNEWIPVKTRRPTEYGKYLVYRAGCQKTQFQIWNNTGWAYDNADITHWMEVPPSPPTTKD